MKTVVVLLATYNGLQWLAPQVKSLLNQEEVNIKLLISDDLSTDGSWEWLQAIAQEDDRITLLPRGKKFGCAAKNFYHLLEVVNCSEADFFAYADQDDVWEKNKLISHIKLLTDGGYEGLSSNVEAFWPNGKTLKIVKSQAQKRYDFLFESAGPGCTFLMTPWLIEKLKQILAEPQLKAKEMRMHDWLSYAVCRAAGGNWLIDERVTVRYRQHADNELGVNKGIKAMLFRLKKISNGWYFDQVLKVLHICYFLSARNEFAHFISLLKEEKVVWKRLGLLRHIFSCRRKFIDSVLLAIMVIFWAGQTAKRNRQ